MSEVLNLLKEKNFFLEKFLEESREKRVQFKARRFENLQKLYEKREKILSNIEIIDKKINKTLTQKSSVEMNSPNKNKMIRVLQKIRSNISDILDQDLQIISYIENEKSEIIKEIFRKQKIENQKDSFTLGFQD